MTVVETGLVGMARQPHQPWHILCAPLSCCHEEARKALLSPAITCGLLLQGTCRWWCTLLSSRDNTHADWIPFFTAHAWGVPPPEVMLGEMTSGVLRMSASPCTHNTGGPYNHVCSMHRLPPGPVNSLTAGAIQHTQHMIWLVLPDDAGWATA